MTTALASAVELLERSLGYTRAALAGVTEARLWAPTPCRDWTLRDLLAHMDDSLDAFTEAAGGSVALTRGPAAHRVTVLQQKACALLGLWSGQGPPGVRVGGVDLATDLLVATAALEVAVHGWDVHASVGSDIAFPEALARDLLPVVPRVVDPRHFASPIPPTARSGAVAALLGLVGRSGPDR